MNAPVTFNTLAFVRKLEASGMNVQQAEALAEALGEIVFETTAAKADVTAVRTDMREDSTAMRAEMRGDFAAVRTDLRELELRLQAQFRELELRLMTRLGAALAGSTALVVAIIGTLISLHH